MAHPVQLKMTIPNGCLTIPILFFYSPRIQELDGGFFEKFGSLLRQKSAFEEEQLATPLAPLPELSGDEDGPEVDEVYLQARSMAMFEAENDSGRETLHDTDSEPEDAQSVLGQLIEDAFGWNVSESSEVPE